MSAVYDITGVDGIKGFQFSPSGPSYKSKQGMDGIRNRLNACGISVEETEYYDINMEAGIMEFQSKNGLPVTGIFDEETAKKLKTVSDDAINNSVNDDIEEEEYSVENINVYPHYDSFFRQESDKTVRKSHKDIIIKFGDGQIEKRLIDVYMRSIGVEIDTSGNPISETYEFIARDLKEKEVIEDKKKYLGLQEKLQSASDIKYNFDAIRK